MKHYMITIPAHLHADPLDDSYVKRALALYAEDAARFLKDEIDNIGDLPTLLILPEETHVTELSEEKR